MSIETIMAEIETERTRQDSKWGEQNHDPFLYLTILGEEYGEACEAALDARFGHREQNPLRQELVQVAAVAIAAIECLDRSKWEWGGHA